MNMVLFKIIAVMLWCLVVSGCYHMRVNPEPLPTKQIVTNKRNEVAIRIIQRVLENELNIRILDEESNGRTLISAPRLFATDTSFGMPAGGRHYYVQYRFELARDSANHCVVTIRPYNYDMRTSYAYNLEGKVKTLYKIYPYPEYPGMFDLTFLEQEMQKIAALLESALKDIE
jgi:hypothetical protein